MTKQAIGISELPWAVRCVMTQDGSGGHKRFEVYGTRDICTMDGDLPADEADATFIVRACNAYDDLVAACEMAVKREGDYLGALCAALAKAQA